MLVVMFMNGDNSGYLDYFTLDNLNYIPSTCWPDFTGEPSFPYSHPALNTETAIIRPTVMRRSGEGNQKKCFLFLTKYYEMGKSR